MRSSHNMDRPNPNSSSSRRTAAQPLHIQRLESSLNMGPFMNYAQSKMLSGLTSSDDSDSEDGNDGVNGYSTSPSGKIQFRFLRKPKAVRKVMFLFVEHLMYNFSQVGSDRKWLQNILITESDSDEISDEDEYIREMLKEHVLEQKLRVKYYQNANVNQNIKLFISMMKSLLILILFTECPIWVLRHWIAVQPRFI